MTTQEVDAWFVEYENPMIEVIQQVRAVILAADRRIEETIKWKSPTFVFNGNLASFNPRSKKHASLLFHIGAHIPGDHPTLEGGGDTARYMTFADEADVLDKQAGLEAVVRAWCERKR